MAYLSSPTFLLGTQRSGTTLLSRILSSNSQLYIQNEMPKYRIFDEPLTREYLDLRITKRLKDIYKIDAYELSSQGVQWGWKDPMLTEHLDVLHKYYKDSKFILIVRDPRAVVQSYIDNAWGLGTNVYSGAIRWRNELSKQISFAKSKEINSLILRYEDLVTFPEKELLKICNFLEITYDENMLDFHKRPLEFKENKSNVNTKKPLSVNNMCKWKDTFSERQIGIINIICKEIMSEFDYKEESDYFTSINALERTFYRVHQKVLGEIQLQYQLRKARYLNRK